MTDKDAYAVAGYLLTNSLFYSQTILENQHKDYTNYITKVFSSNDPISCDLRENILTYLQKLDMPYELAIDILRNEIKGFYHISLLGSPHVVKGDYDYIDIDYETGRIGIWCEVDGFTCWLDAYKKMWSDDKQEVENWLTEYIEEGEGAIELV